MTMHRLHPIYDKATAEQWGLPEPDTGHPTLFDHCDRCAEHAEFPLGLDDNNLRDMWCEMVEAEHNIGYYRNNTEAKAGRYLYHVALFMERMLGVNPWQDLTSLRWSLKGAR